MKSKLASVDAEWDWLGYAIGKLGGPNNAAALIGVSPSVIYSWLEFGLAAAKFAHVVKIFELADVPLQYLARRLGPYEGDLPRARKLKNRKAA